MSKLGSAFIPAFALILGGCDPASDPAKDKNKAESEAKPAPTRDKNRAESRAQVELSVREKLLGRWEGTNHEAFKEFNKDGKMKSSFKDSDGKMMEHEGTYILADGRLETHARVGNKVYEGVYRIKALTETTLILESLISKRVLEYKKK
jgi:uncharacterized protein (TIGR03066 family)